MNLMFFVNSALLGVGLAMDAFSVSLANGLNDPKMTKGKMCGMAGVFAFFQALMPMLGWICVHTVVQCFTAFEKFIPWIAFILLGFIGGKMLFEGFKSKGEEFTTEAPKVGLVSILVQGVATSIDALAVRISFATLKVDIVLAVVSIGVITAGLSIMGVFIGKKFGDLLNNKATILGGIILIFIGLKIFVEHMWL